MPETPSPNRVGFYCAGSYLLIVVSVFAYTTYHTKPENVGYDWIPFYLLSLPWTSIIPGARQNFMIGFFLNGVFFYLLGWLLGWLPGRLRK